MIKCYYNLVLLLLFRTELTMQRQRDEIRKEQEESQRRQLDAELKAQKAQLNLERQRNRRPVDSPPIIRNGEYIKLNFIILI